MISDAFLLTKIITAAKLGIVSLYLATQLLERGAGMEDDHWPTLHEDTNRPLAPLYGPPIFAENLEHIAGSSCTVSSAASLAIHGDCVIFGYVMSIHIELYIINPHVGLCWVKLRINPHVGMVSGSRYFIVQSHIDAQSLDSFAVFGALVA